MYVGFTLIFPDMGTFVLLLSTILKPWVRFLSSNGYTHPILALPRVVNLHTWKIRLTEPRLSPNNAKKTTKQKKNSKPTLPEKTQHHQRNLYPSARLLVFLSHHTTTTFFSLTSTNKTEIKSRKEDRQLEDLLLYKSMSNYWLRSPQILCSQIQDLGKNFFPI